jgi:molybdopterin converting factor small subunit
LRKGSEHPVILLCGEYLELPTALDHPLKEGDEIVILQGIGGG